MKIKTFIIIGVAFLSSVGASAQGQDNNLFNHLSVGLNVGTPGIGLDVAMPVCNYVQVRAGFAVFPKLKTDDQYDLDKSAISSSVPSSVVSQIPDHIDIEAKTGFTNGMLLFDIFPSKNSVFHFTAGAYFGSSKIVEAYNMESGLLKAVSAYNSYDGVEKIGVEFGDYLLTPDADGNVKAKIETASFKPYLGIGFGRAVPKTKRVGFMFELGCQFWGSPKVYCNDVQLSDADIDGEAGGAVKTLSKIIVYPTLNFRLCGRIF